MMTALDGAGRDAPVVLLANGGDHSFYHDRRDGPWGSYVLHELLPATVQEYSLDPGRVAFAGISMGGFGALHLATRVRQAPCGVASIAPALWLRSRPLLQAARRKRPASPEARGPGEGFAGHERRSNAGRGVASGGVFAVFGHAVVTACRARASLTCSASGRRRSGSNSSSAWP